jgi:hypothetical protein
MQPLQAPQRREKPPARAGIQHGLIRKDPTAQEIHAVRGTVDLPGRLESEPQFVGQPAFDLEPQAGSSGRVSGPNHHVVHIPDTSGNSRLAGDPVIKPCEKVIGEMLTGNKRSFDF